MTFPEWLDGERGRLVAVAERFSVSRSAVSQWRDNGVPRDLILDVHRFTGGAVSLEDLVRRPDEKVA